MVYNITAPVTAARFVNIPYEPSKFMKSYNAAMVEGTEDAKLALDQMTVKEVRGKYARLKKEVGEHSKNIDVLKLEYDHLTDTIAAYEDLTEWAKGFLIFEHPAMGYSSSFKRSIADSTVHNLYNIKDDLKVDEYQRDVFDDSVVFSIEHNWFNAINRADEFAAGSFRLPYEICIFEFKISHRPVIAICSNYANDGAENEIVMQFAVESLAGWALAPNIYKHTGGEWGVFNNNYRSSSDVDFQRLIKLIGAQIRAACIALDAEVATTNLVRAVHSGHEADLHSHPEYEFYTISLANRQRAEALRSSGEVKGVKRLHFRRGHWRHYLTSKTWVRWCLVGNPELGFIDKQYRL